MTNMAAVSSWWDLAACQSADPELFFPVSAARSAAAEIDRAKAVCASCAISGRCLDYALRTRQAHGVWGGMSEQERQVLVARGRRAELVTQAG
jgi:WhiB family transcriptional regulator, redox-sensing transcriptional regulator